MRATASASRASAPGDESIAVRAGERGQPEADLVGAVPAELALVTILEVLAARAALAHLLDALFERSASVFLTLLQRLGGLIDELEQLGDDREDGRAVAVEPPRDLVPRRTPRSQPAVG